MTKGISINFLANVQPVLQGTGDVEGAFSKVGKSLDDVTKDGVSSTKQLEESFSQLAQRQISSSNEAKQAALRNQQETTDGFELSAREQNKIQKEGLKAGATAITQQVAQSAQGFDGTASGILETATSIGVGIAALATGPLALVAAAGTLAFSIISGFMNKAAADTKELNADVSTLTGSLEDIGLKGVSSVSAVNKELEKFSTTTDGSDKDLTHLKSTADDAGVSFKLYADALAGNKDAQETLFPIVQKQIQALDEQSKKWTGSSAAQQANYGKLQKQLAALQSVSDALEKQNHTLGLSKDRLDLFGKAHEGAALQTKADADAQAAYSSATLAVFDNLGSQIEAKQNELNQNAEAAAQKTKHAVVAANVETAQSFIDAQNSELKTLEDNGAAEIEIYEKFGSNAAKVIKDAGDNTNLLQSLAGSSPEQVQQILDNYTRLGNQAGTNFKKDAEDIVRGADLVPKAVKIPVLLDSGAAEEKLKRLGNGLTITVNGFRTRSGEYVS